MTISTLRRLLLVGMIAWLGAVIVGCKSKLEGKYVGTAGAVAVEFKSGKAILTTALGESETDDYTVDGNKITVKSKTGDLPFTLMNDGSIEGPLGTLKKSAG